MASEQEIANGVASLLRQYDPNAIPSLSVTGIVKQLEAKLGVELSDKAPFIHDLLARFYHQPSHSHSISNSNSNSHPHPPLHHLTNPPFPSPPHHLFQCPPSRTLPLSTPLPQQRHQQEQQQQQPQPPPPPPAAPTPSIPASPKESMHSGAKRRGGPGGLNKVCGVSPELQTIVGAPTMPRTEIVKQLWAYIRKHNCQDPSNKRKIICDDALRIVFETDCTDMFKMNKLLAKHIIPLEPSKELCPDAKRVKATESEPMTPFSEPPPLPVIISDVLAKFFGTGEREMLQSEAVKRVWEYIKVNQLEFQDPVINGLMVHCDGKLKVLFECENLPALRISEMLMRHFFKIS